MSCLSLLPVDFIATSKDMFVTRMAYDLLLMILFAFSLLIINSSQPFIDLPILSPLNY